MNRIRQAWITLNRQCNLRCGWCYARSTEYHKKDDMQGDLVAKIIDFLSEFDLEYIALIGGEPTCYPYLEEIIKKIRDYGIKSSLITNGVLLSDKKYLDRLISNGLNSVNLSLKGWSRESYFKNTGIDAYKKTFSAVRNVSESQLESMISFVISYENVACYLDAIKDAYAQGARNFYLSFVQDFSILDGNAVSPDLNKIFYTIDQFTASYDRLCATTGGKFLVHQSYPLCIWNHDFIKKLFMNKQILTSCQLMERSGLIFDTDGSLIPCNSMYQTQLARFGVDFTSKHEFELFWNSDKVRNIYKRLSSMPGYMCDNCEEYQHCGGGCIANWIYYNQDQLMNAYQIYKQN